MAWLKWVYYRPEPSHYVPQLHFIYHILNSRVCLLNLLSTYYSLSICTYYSLLILFIYFILKTQFNSLSDYFLCVICPGINKVYLLVSYPLLSQCMVPALNGNMSCSHFGVIRPRTMALCTVTLLIAPAASTPWDLGCLAKAISAAVCSKARQTDTVKRLQTCALQRNL